MVLTIEEIKARRENPARFDSSTDLGTLVGRVIFSSPSNVLYEGLIDGVHVFLQPDGLEGNREVYLLSATEIGPDGNGKIDITDPEMKCYSSRDGVEGRYIHAILDERLRVAGI